ncbi:pyridoxamine phosphate oxidase family protein [Xylariaceae sp. FL0255]|nr:pyridoxamine phosphate oxidase family protein [Xylariaceae sp. FL0255]
MGVYYEEIPESLIPWILAQKLFWVSTAPLSGGGHVNVSPKGGDSSDFFRVPDRRTFLYTDMTGSGAETISHIHEPGNGRITILFNAFEGAPKIIRLWGKGRVLEFGTEAFQSTMERENLTCPTGIRSIIVVDIHQVGSSCGFQVPFFNFVDHRYVLRDYFRTKQAKFDRGNEKESMDRYWALNSAFSLDGLPAMRRGIETGRELAIRPTDKFVGPLAPKNVGFSLGYSKGGQATVLLNHVSHIAIALLAVLVAILAATHPAFEFFPAQRRVQDLMVQVTSKPGSPSAATIG